MPNNNVIQTSRSSDLVTFDLIIEGDTLPDTVHVQSIVVQKEINRIPYAKISIVDGDVSLSDFPLSNEDTFIPGNEIEVLAGYHSDNESIFKGIIVNHKLRVRDGRQELVIECRDKAYKMHVNRSSGYFYDQKDSDLMEQLISRNGLEAEVAATNFTHPELTQYQCTDWDFLVTRAQANGRIVLVEGGKVLVTEPDLAQDSLETVTFGANILEFDAEIDARNQVESVSTQAWNSADQVMEKIEANDPGISLNGNLSPSNLADRMGLGPIELRNGGRIAEVSLQDWADSKWLIQQLSKIRGRVKFQGIPQAAPGKLIDLSGVGNRFSGKAFVSGVMHQLAAGNWLVDVQFGMDPEWFSEKFPIHAQPASGLFGAVKGLQIGKVSQLQDDPEGEDRIMVTLPVINGEEQGIWCRLACLDAGNERGIVFRPEIEDEVIVGFINEDPNQAVVLGSLHSSKNPAPIALADDNHQKGYVSREGIKILFDDEKAAVTIETPKGKKFSLDDDADQMEMSDDHGNTVILNADGIEVESAGDLILKCSGDLSLEGTNVKVRAQAEFTAEGSAGSTVSSSATTTIKGSLIQIN
ncbi:type VI secretion system tip protein VgrG [Cyclobacterium plantarum]|uniref:Type VI secretion system tip protein VgrG n=1 Tax=Cyclobacterium plantarum TaxID=2716263 RepID=A0ABX0HAY5_9BACT|nr:type VI secretion system tip protein VgrG [Cyclobacterium plantarum]NHE57484.1 type VI secretion system tip protein VgrG [Cyclobacterium plantarum]